MPQSVARFAAEQISGVELVQLVVHDPRVTEFPLHSYVLFPYPKLLLRSYKNWFKLFISQILGLSACSLNLVPTHNNASINNNNNGHDAFTA